MHDGWGAMHWIRSLARRRAAAAWARIRRPAVVFCACSALYCLAPGGIRAASYSEQEVRAIYLYNFSVFMDWPDPAFESSASPFRYCVLGDQGLAATLRGVLAGEQVKGRRLRLTVPRGPGDWRRCHVLYLHGSLGDGMRTVLDAVRGAPVLTVGDSEAFARAGGMVGLARKGRRMRPVVNRREAQAVEIRISSKLLSLSTLVDTDKGESRP